MLQIGTPDCSQSGSRHNKDIQAPYAELGTEVKEGSERLVVDGSNLLHQAAAHRKSNESIDDALEHSVSVNDVRLHDITGEYAAAQRNLNDLPAGPSMPSSPAAEVIAGGFVAPQSIYLDPDTSQGSNSSGHWLKRFSDIPLNLRGRAEAWEVPREQIRMCDEVGRGTGGVVYKARWRGLECAAKILSTENSSVSIEYHDMINEITVISHLRHPNLVLFLGACTYDGELLILSEFMAGGSLEDRFNLMRQKLGKPWKPPRHQTHNWMLDLTRAVCFLHSCTNPIMHRDLKPSNLLLSENNHLKVSDFGLCKTMAKVKEDGMPYSMTGCTGTKRYMAPEVVLSKPDYDLKVDVYSMAMIFWYMFKGERPFEQVEPQLISVLASTRGLRPDAKAIHWPPVESLVEQMWDEDPKRRPNCSEILVILKPLVLPADAAKKMELGNESAGYDCNVSCRCSIM